MAEVKKLGTSPEGAKQNLRDRFLDAFNADALPLDQELLLRN